MENNLPNRWISCSLKDITKNYDANRIPLSKKERENIDGIYPYYGASGIIDYVDNFLFEGEYLLIGEDGANLVTRTKPIAFKADGKFWVNNHAHVIRTLGNIPQSFLLYYINSIRLEKYVTGTAQPKMTQKAMNSIKIPLPPLPEQHRIVEKIEEEFTRLDAGVLALKKAKALIPKYRQAVLKAAMCGDLTEEWRAEHPDVESADEFISITLDRLECIEIKQKKLPDEEIGNKHEIPINWKWKRIGDISIIVRGGSPRPAGHPKYFGGVIPWITVREITKDNDIYLTNTSNFVNEEGKKKSRYIEEGTFLLTNSGATLGVPKITKISGCINDGSVAILGIDGIFKLYLYYVLSSKTKYLRQINQGAAQPNLNTTIVGKILIPIPPLPEQHEIVCEIERRFSVIDEMEKAVDDSLAKAERLLQSVLKKAFEGRLVPQNPDDEPASVLLERIQAEKEQRAAEEKTRKKGLKKLKGEQKRQA